jgi:ketosteroid isomerase-like protein
MSQENVEIARTVNDAFTRGDWDAVAAYLDADVLVRADPSLPEQRLYGREAVVAWYRSAWESMGSDLCVEEIFDLGDRALIRKCWFIRGQHSGAQGEMRYSELNIYREGRVILSEIFLEHEQALEAVGLDLAEPGIKD